MITNKALLSYASGELSRLPSRHPTLPLNRHDWDDIQSTILRRVHAKRHLLDSDRPFKPYVKTIIGRAFQNEIRDRCAKTGYAVRNAAPLVTRVIESDDDGQTEIVYEPDVAAPQSNLPPNARESVDAIVKTLGPLDQQIIAMYDAGLSWREVGEKLHLDPQWVRQQWRRKVKVIRARLADPS